jgi:hypothetical protein
MKRLVIILLLAVSISGVEAQDMKTLFTNMPDAVIPQLETAWRKDLIDLYLSGKEARLQNTMNGYSELLQLTGDYLLLRVTERSTVEMKRLPLINNTGIICVITTVEGPVADSRAAFYAADWQLLDAPSALFSPPSASWFIKDGVDVNSDAFLDALAALDMDLMQYRLSPDSLTLTATFTTPLYLGDEAKAKVRPFLKDAPRVYTWDKSSFR